MENRNDFAVGTKLWMFFCVLTASFFAGDYRRSALLALIGFLYLILQKKRRLLFSCALSYAVLAFLMIGIRFFGWRTVLISEFHVLLFWNLFPIMMVSWDLILTPPGEISAFLSGQKVPVFVILGVLVLFRFVPTMRSELRRIHESMKNRGLLEKTALLKHPLHSVEYVLIPLLLRFIQIADQLSVSAMTRGAGCPGKRSSYYESKSSMRDFLWMIFGTAVLLAAVMTKGIR